MGWSLTIYVWDPNWWCFGKSVHIETTWVWSTQKRIRVVRHGDSSEDIGPTTNRRNHGEKEKRSELRLRNFGARHGKIEPGAALKSRKVLSGVEGGKGICFQWKEKGQCSQGDRCSFRHETKIVRKNQNTLQPHLLSQPHHEVEVCRGRELSEAKVNMGPLFDNRADITWKVPARDRLVNIGIRQSAQPNKKVQKERHSKKKRKRRQECCGDCEKSITIGLCVTRFRRTRFSK